MKKMILAIIMMVVCQFSHAQSIEALFNEFKDVAKAEYVHMPKLMTSIATKFVSNEIKKEDNIITSELIKKVESLRMLDLGDCSNNVKNRFNEALEKFTYTGYEELMRANDDGEKVRIMTRTENERVRELLIISGGDDDCALVQFKVNLSPDEIDKLVSSQMTKNKK